MKQPLLYETDRSRTLCFTGHRPEKLPPDPTMLYKALYYHIARSLDLGYRCFLDGLADGVDYAAAMSLFRLRRDHPDIVVIGVQPCEDYEEFYRRRGYDPAHLRQMLDGLDRRIILPGSYHRSGGGVFLTRNRFMAEHSGAIIAVCSPGRSGSAQALRYARSLGLHYLRIDPGSRYPRTPEDWVTARSGL